MRVKVFAVLKDYFDKEFVLKSDEQPDVATLRANLSALNTSAHGVLQLCRFAVDNEFVDDNHKLNDDDTICIFPPSSGG